MTEKIKSAIGALKLARDTRFFMPNNKDLEIAIRSLQAWEEALQELEVKQKSIHDYALDLEDDFYLGKARGFERSIEIINQKLSEIEEVR